MVHVALCFRPVCTRRGYGYNLEPPKIGLKCFESIYRRFYPIVFSLSLFDYLSIYQALPFLVLIKL